MADLARAVRGVAKDFLKYLNDSQFGEVARKKRITLFGADEDVLKSFGQQLSDYLLDQGEQVRVELGTSDYNVNVSWCLNRYQ